MTVSYKCKNVLFSGNTLLTFATSCVKYRLRFMWERRRSCMWECLTSRPSYADQSAQHCEKSHDKMLRFQISCCAAGGRAVLSNDASGALFSVCISQLYGPQKHIDMRTKGKGEITAALFVQKAKKDQFLCSFIQKRLHPPHATSHCSLLISLKSCYRLKVRNFHSASAEQFRSS